MVEWSYYDRFKKINDKYLPAYGEGDTKATQVVTAVTKLVYKWYNDGDVFDNNYYLSGWANDLSPYANWLYHKTTEKVKSLLKMISDCYSYDDYEELLKALADTLLDESYLGELNKEPKEDSIYIGYVLPFSFIERDENNFDEEEDW